MSFADDRIDNAREKRVEPHLHTNISKMDALTDVNEVVDLAAKWGMPAVAVTNHCSIQSFPGLAEAAQGKLRPFSDVKPITSTILMIALRYTLRRMARILMKLSVLMLRPRGSMPRGIPSQKLALYF